MIKETPASDPGSGCPPWPCRRIWRRPPQAPAPPRRPGRVRVRNCGPVRRPAQAAPPPCECPRAIHRLDAFLKVSRSAQTASIMLSPAVRESVYGWTPGAPETLVVRHHDRKALADDRRDDARHPHQRIGVRRARTTRRCQWCRARTRRSASPRQAAHRAEPPRRRIRRWVHRRRPDVDR